MADDVVPSSRARRRWRIYLAGAVVAVLTVPTWSLAHALTGPGNDGLATRSVEWTRDHHGVWLVDHVERWWYVHHTPPVGGNPPSISSPPPPSAPAAPTTTAVEAAAPPPPTEDHPTAGPTHAVVDGTGSGGEALPAPIVSPAEPPVPGEGVWTPAPSEGRPPSMFSTLVRPDAIHTSELVGVVRLDHRKTVLRLFPGLSEPGGSFATPPAVPEADLPKLLAAFNGGFRMRDARGGFYDEGVTARPLVNGAASLVIRNDGSASVGAWGRDATLTPDVQSVRQNLVLLVDGGAVAPDIDGGDERRWGSTLGNKVLVWRSGIGETADGDLVYAAGPSLSAASLADLLVRAGAVRAMELDINSEWTTFNFYAPDAGGTENGTKLLPTMRRSATRYLTPDSRDFFGVFARPASR